MPTLLKPDLAVRGDKAAGTVRVLIDTGAEASFIRRAVAEQLGTLGKLPIPIRIVFGDNSRGDASEGVRIALDLGGHVVSDDFVVMDTLVEDLVLGAGTLRRYALKVDMGTSAVYAAIATEPTTDKKTEPSATLPRKEPAMIEQLKALCAQLGIAMPEGMTDEQAMAAITEVGTARRAVQAPAAPPAVAAPAVLAALGVAADASLDQVQGKILALTHRADVVSVADFNALKVQLHERDKKDALEGAILAGKLTPAEKDSWKTKLDSGEITLATFNAFVAERPIVSPLGVPRPKAPEKTTLATVQLDDIQAQVNKQLGLDNATFAKYAAN